MKSILKHALFATAGAALLSSSAMAVVTYTAGDLLLGFQAVGDPDTYVYNLGSSISFRDGTNPGFLGNINSDLTLAFGGNWSTNPNITFGVVGAHSSQAPPISGTTGTVNGDPRQTVYASIRTTVPAGSSPWILAPASAAGTAATGIVSFATGVGGFNTATETANSGGRGAIISNTDSDNSWADYNNGSTSFSVFGTDLEQQIGSTPGAVYYLDIYRILRTNNGANPAGTPGTGTYVTTLMLDSQGNLYAIPEPTSSALLGIGAGLVLFRRRRSSATA